MFQFFKKKPDVELAAMTDGSLYKIRRKEKSIIMAILEGKKAIIIGDRDGIPGPAIAECVKTAGAEVVFSSTECFV